MRKFVSVLALSTIVLTACGGSDGDDSGAATTEKAVATASTISGSTSAAPTSAAPSSTAPTSTAAAAVTTAAPATAAPAGSAAITVDATLSEWKIEAATAIKAGKVTINVKNAGQNAHELVVFKGSYASLPKVSNGAVDVDKLAAGALVGEIENLRSGTTGTGTYDLTPGTYAFVCNLTGGGSSHAARGQVLDVTVS